MARNHLEMVDAVNDATTERERYRLGLMLNGWRECADHLGVGWSGVEADLHTTPKDPGIRICLMCGREFASTHAGNRRCSRCRDRVFSADTPYNPGIVGAI